jgi:hypothetical protein
MVARVGPQDEGRVALLCRLNQRMLGGGSGCGRSAHPTGRFRFFLLPDQIGIHASILV